MATYNKRGYKSPKPEVEKKSIKDMLRKFEGPSPTTIAERKADDLRVTTVAAGEYIKGRLPHFIAPWDRLVYNHDMIGHSK